MAAPGSRTNRLLPKSICLWVMLAGALMMVGSAFLLLSNGGMTNLNLGQLSGRMTDDTIVPFLPGFMNLPSASESGTMYDLDTPALREIQHVPFKELRAACYQDPRSKVPEGKEFIIYELSIGNSGSSWQARMISLIAKIKGYYMPVTLVHKNRAEAWVNFEKFISDLGFKPGEPIRFKDITRPDMLQTPEELDAGGWKEVEGKQAEKLGTVEVDLEEEERNEEILEAIESTEGTPQEIEPGLKVGDHLGTLLKVLHEVPALTDEAHIKFSAFKFVESHESDVNEDARGTCACCFVLKDLLGNSEAEIAMIHMHALSLGIELSPAEIFQIRQELALWLFAKYCFPGSGHLGACRLLDEFPDARQRFAFNNYDSFEEADKV